MKNLGIIYGEGIENIDLDFIVKLSRELEIDLYDIKSISDESAKNLKMKDILVVIGSDRTILRLLLYLNDISIPILPLYGHGIRSFLSVKHIEELPYLIKKLLRDEYRIERRVRLKLEAEGRKYPPILNEIAILSGRTGCIIKHLLKINDEVIWRDESDGVLISTPTGSTAYALSAGGPIITSDTGVVEIVPVNSLILTHRPIITSAKNVISISDIYPSDYILILDGQLRYDMNRDSLIIKKADKDAYFVKFPMEGYPLLESKLKDKVILGSMKHIDIKRLSPSARLIYNTLRYEGGLTLKELLGKTGLTRRTLLRALKSLKEKDLVIRKTYSRDTRQAIYFLKNS